MRMGQRQRCIAFLRRLLVRATLPVPFRLMRMDQRQRCIAFLRRLLVRATMNLPRSI
jgi:hypothetical protein